MPLLHPKDITIATENGDKTYILSKFPAVQGREIVCKYPLSAMPKLGDYAVNEETMLKLMAFVAVRTEDGKELTLTTRALIDNHIPDFETLMKLEWAMLEYNVSFLRSAGSSDFLSNIVAKARPFATKILTDLLEQSSRKGGQPSKS